MMIMFKRSALARSHKSFGLWPFLVIKLNSENNGQHIQKKKNKIKKKIDRENFADLFDLFTHNVLVSLDNFYFYYITIRFSSFYTLNSDLIEHAFNKRILRFLKINRILKAVQYTTVL